MTFFAGDPPMPFRSPTVRAVAALSVTQLIGWGATFWLPAVTGSAMAGDLGLTLPMVMAGPTIMLVVMAMVSWPLSTIFERHGARPVMAMGSPLGAVGLLVMGLADGPVPYVLSWIILGLAGAGMLTTPAQIAVTEIAGDKARKALDVLFLAGGLTSTIVWPLTGILQAQWGWRTTTLIYAALLLFVCSRCIGRRSPAGPWRNPLRRRLTNLRLLTGHASPCSPRALPPMASSPGVLP